MKTLTLTTLVMFLSILASGSDTHNNLREFVSVSPYL